jgi:hypothetical protein
MAINMTIQDINIFETDDYINYNVKELKKICEYYGLKRGNKLDMISKIMLFESDLVNSAIVSKRKIMWSFICELNNNSKMKKYILWP